MQVMYIGQSAKALNLKQFRVYSDYPETLIKPLQQDFPQIEKLFVPIDSVSESISELNKKGSALYVINAKLSSFKFKKDK